MKVFAFLAAATMASLAYVAWDRKEFTAFVVAVAAGLYFFETFVSEMDVEP